MNGLSGFRLEFKVCPDCGMHAEVQVLDGQRVAWNLVVISKEEALHVHELLIDDGGTWQEQFLAMVEASDLLETIRGMSVIELLLFMSGQSGSGRASVGMPEERLDLIQGSLSLKQCSGCKEDGRIYLTLPGQPRRYLAQVWSKAEACEVLDIQYSRGLPDQPEFEAAVRAADWLPGPMPVKLG